MSQDLTHHSLSVTMVDMEITYEVENAEDELNAFAQQAEDAPHRWGQEQEAHLSKLAENLRRLYEKHNTPENERMAL